MCCGATTSFCGSASRSGTSLFLPSNYAEKKIAENNEAEIMGVVAEDAQESYAPECIVTLRSESADEMESNAERIVQWIHAWRQQRGLEA